ncbi:MAG: hypothetical protein SFY69_07190 [Planctomycetota bacterium]|nr:hypothetical protein [Planctomycetota bacterium]
MIRRLMTTVSVLVLGAASLPAAAGEPDVALIAADSAAALADVQTKLMNTGLFNSVTTISAVTNTPTLAELQQFEAVMTWSNQTYQNAAGLGDAFADYVDAGGGVVVAVFATSTTTANRSLGGRFRSGGYEIIPTQGGNTTGAQTLGTILVPGHPTLDGVNTFNGGTSSFRPTQTALSSHGEKIAEWSDGKTLIAVSNQYSNRVDLGMFPTSRDVSGGSWDPTTDGARILANALVYTVAPPPPPPCNPDFNADGNVDQDDIACIAQVVGGDPTCASADPDFNGDGNVDQSDIAALEQVVAGAPCP